VRHGDVETAMTPSSGGGPGSTVYTKLPRQMAERIREVARIEDRTVHAQTRRFIETGLREYEEGKR